MRSLILFFSVLLAGTFTVPAEQILPDDFHSIPVLIKIPLHDNISEYGTGVFFVESNKLFLITAAHVIFNFNSTNNLELNNSTAKLSAFNKGKDSTDKNLIDLNLKMLLDEGFVKRHSTHDVAVIQLGIETPANTNGIKYVIWGKGVASYMNPAAKLVECSATDVRYFKDIPDGNETYIFGYPVELLNSQVTLELNQVDFDSPLVRKGIISQRNQQTGRLIIDSGVYGGNSGGPVVIVEHPTLDVTVYKIGGLITQFVPVSTKMFPQAGVTNSVFVNSGYGVAEPIDYAIELMRE